MEFIPLEKYSKKTKNKESIEQKKGRKNKKLNEDESVDETVTKKTQSQQRTKVIQKKNVKNKYKETLALKQKKRVPKKKKPKKTEEEEDEEIEEEKEMDVDGEEKAETQEEEGEDETGEEEEKDEDETGEEEEKDEDETGEEEEEGEQNDEDAFKRKCKEMDEKKKNRLFVRLKKKILNKAQIKELHPDIRDVIFPRKRNTRWCWAVFASEERADEAMKQLIKNKEVLVSKPTPYDKVDKKRKEKIKTVLRKKEARKKLQKMWM